MRLSIDLSNRAGSLSLHKIESGRPLLIGVQSMEGENRHSELLLTQLPVFLKAHSVEPKHLTELATSLGPGSFTGMRIAISTMKAFAMAWKLPLFLVNGSEARARAFKKRNATNSDILVLTKVASKSYAQALLSSTGEFREDETTELGGLVIDESCVLVDSEETKNALEIPTTVFPVQAEYLGEQLEACTSRVDCRNFEELVKASPVYYGSSRF